MERAVKDKTLDIDAYKKIFNQVMKLLDGLNDQTVFKNERNFFVPAYYEGITIGVAQNYEKYESDTDLLKKKIIKLKTDEDFKKYSGSASNSKNRIKNRLKRANQIFG